MTWATFDRTLNHVLPRLRWGSERVVLCARFQANVPALLRQLLNREAVDRAILRNLGSLLCSNPKMHRLSRFDCNHGLPFAFDDESLILRRDYFPDLVIASAG